MITVNVCYKPHWILHRLTTELVENIPGVRMNDAGWPPKGSSDAEVQYFLPGRNIRHCPRPPTGILVGFFTHGDHHVKDYWHRFRVCLAMNQRMAALLRQSGAKDVRVLRPGTDPPRRPIVFGVCARSVESRGPKTRKGLELVAAAAGAGYTFVACSPDPPHIWPCPITHHTDDREAFYRSIDYLVVTSRDEGGPMVVPEAQAHAVPVIAPPSVGWCGEFDIIPYDREKPQTLLDLLHRLTHPPSWEGWVNGHLELFRELERR